MSHTNLSDDKRTDLSYNVTNFDSSVKDALNASGLFAKTDMKHLEKFAKFPYLDPHNRMGRTREYVFFTRPDLNIENSSQDYSAIQGVKKGANWRNTLTNFPKFAEAKLKNKEVYQDLQLTAFNSSHVFSPILYNHRISSIELPDIDAGDIDTSENMWGQKIYYRRSSSASADDFDFSIEFNDTKNLDIYTWFMLYDYYEERKAMGFVAPRERHLIDCTIHDQFAIFKFTVAEDNMTLIHWAKLYGVYPKGVPRSALGSMPDDGNFKISVSFKANDVEDMDILILQDFNYLSKQYNNIGSWKKGYDSKISGMKNYFADYPPYIQISTNGDPHKLLWR